MFQPTRVLRSNTANRLQHTNSIKMAYDLHKPQISVQQNLNTVNQSKEPILFIHGIFGSKKSYAQDCKLISNATHTPVYTLDLRNHGETSHAAPFNYDTLAHDIKDFCDEHNLQKVKLIGYSLGAKVSMLTSLRYPDLIKSAVIIDNAPINQPHLKQFMKTYTKSMKYILDNGKISKDDKEWKEKANELMKRFLPNSNLRRNLLLNLVNKPPKHHPNESAVNFDNDFIQFVNPIHEMEEMIINEVSSWPKDIENVQFKGEVKFIKGTKSPFITKEGEDAINFNFPNSSITKLNSNHDILDQRTNEYIQIITDFFNLHRYQDVPKDANVINYGASYGFQQPINNTTAASA
ncbi:hypothetical protein WICMUC_000052 [Wickerhamomyces mucosus]|uniref:AB hydrolase-1 domain-containing protein n=1 Tax=Wickerhamomyces mucosus TaxID=1378264 RepID=A0A9P8Q162_9ASCO|nr:hypothetical protein WICMUC_000052 [Wickerhamomyces mucosus]